MLSETAVKEKHQSMEAQLRKLVSEMKVLETEIQDRQKKVVEIRGQVVAFQVALGTLEQVLQGQ